ncbi:MAG: guanylate kinase [Deltaproteobacteria bacterium]|nr:guanylate kinase [Deltaproteobacteria bacterium]
MKSSGILFIVSAPSGAGKTTLCRKAVDYFSDLRHSISYTTRPPRQGEKDDVDYHFINKKAFQKKIDIGEFIEWAEVHGNRYGTSFNDIKSLLEKGLDIILDIDVQGARQIKLQIANCKLQIPWVFIFIFPPSLDATKERIKKRGKDTRETILSRLKNARAEIKEAVWYDYLIINDKLEDAFEKLKSIIVAERSKREKMIEQVKRLYGKVLGK